jgi:SNF2 family DNA or RNA helicase
MYGKVEYSSRKKAWEIDCSPAVAIRLKRVFGKVDRAPGLIRISDTPENARDLEWFLERYPMEIDGARPLLTERADKHRARESMVLGLLRGDQHADDFEMELPAREYQRVAASILLRSGGLLCADDVGLGKTIVAIAAMTKAAARPALVVTLAHLPRQWETEINRFAPRLRTHIIKGTKPYDFTVWNGQKLLTNMLPDVLIINYHKLASWGDYLGKCNINLIVWDEVQELRRTASLKFKAAKHLAKRAMFRLSLSATPIYNYGEEFHAVMSCTVPDALGTKEEFLREWCWGWKGAIKDPRAFGAYVRESGIMIRRTRQDVGRELPPLTNATEIVSTDPEALERVTSSCVELARLILAEKSEKGVKFLASEEFSNRLRQATGIAKAPYVAEFVKLLVESGEHVVLYGWHREFYSIVNDRLKHLNPVMFTGSESTQQKERAKQAFINGETPVLIMSLRSGAGMDGLQKVSRTVVFGELDWSPGVLEQCTGRIFRDGQKEPVVAYYLVAEHGADPTMAEVLGLKRGQIQGIKDPKQELVEKLEVSPDHVKRLAEDFLKRREGAIA